MRSTRASAAWAGIALATSFLSVTIVGTQPHSNATRALAESVALTSTRDVVSEKSLKRKDSVTTTSNSTARVD